MVDNDSPWWGPDKQEQSSQTSSDTPKNVFSGDVSSFSTPQAVNVTQMKDPNQFLISQFLIGLFLVPLIAGFLMSLLVLVIDPGGQDNWYYDSNYQPIFDDSVEIDDEDYNTLTVDFNIPNTDLYEIDDNDYYFYTGVSVYGDDWDDYGDCYFDVGYNRLNTFVESEDNRRWYPMECYGVLEDYNFYFLKDVQSITYATDYQSQIDGVYVEGDEDSDVSRILLDLLPFIIPVAYFGILVWSFVSKKKSLGFGLLGGIFVAPFSFCFSMIFLSLFFWDL
jgi:hypothetical protein